MRAHRTQTVWRIDNVVKLHRSSLNHIKVSHGVPTDSHPWWNYDATWCQSLANFFLLYSQAVLSSSHFAVALFAQPCMRLITHIIIMIKSRYGVLKWKQLMSGFWWKEYIMLKDPHEHWFIQGPPGQIVDSRPWIISLQIYFTCQRNWKKKKKKKKKKLKRKQIFK